MPFAMLENARTGDFAALHPLPSPIPVFKWRGAPLIDPPRGASP